MKKQTPKRYYPHRERRSDVHSLVLSPLYITGIIFLILWLTSCTGTRYGCPAHSGKRYMSGYSLRQAIDKYGGSWVSCKETGITCIFNPEGKLIGYYHENNNK